VSEDDLVVPIKTIALLLLVACDSGSQPVPEIKPTVVEINPTCASQDKHTANAAAWGHLGRALLQLLLSRDCARRVDPTSQDLETPIRIVLAQVCGFDGPTPGLRKKAIVDAATLDELFPQVDDLTATSAGCGVLFHRDGRRTRGKGVVWDH
jgi:hypothetical protein